MAELLKGKPVVDSMALDLRARIEALGRAKVVPALALVRVGQRPDDLSYERTARKRAESLGIAIRPYELDEFAPQAAIEAAIHEVNRDENVHGCLLFRPLPSFVDESHMCELLDPKKDIDGITLASLASVFTDGHGLPARDGGRVHSAARSLPGAAPGQARRGGGTQPRRGQARVHDAAAPQR